MELNVNELRKIAGNNETSKAVFEELGTRLRSRARINIRKLKYEMLTKGKGVIEKDFMDTFIKLQQAGVGTIITGRLGNQTRFLWNYKLKDITSAVIKPVKSMQPEIRPKEVLPSQNGGRLSITFSLSPDVRSEDLAALISLVKEMEKR